MLIWDLARHQPRVERVKLSEEQLADHWRHLAGSDAATADLSLCQLSAASAQAVSYLNQRLQAVPEVPKDKVRALIADLDSQVFAKRDQASRELIHLQETAEEALPDLLKGTPSLEVRRRAESILLKLTESRSKPPPLAAGEELQAVRAVEVLEKIATPEVHAILVRIARGSPRAWRTREAQASVQRMEGRD